MSKSGVYLISASSVDKDKNAAHYTSPDDVNLKMASEQKQAAPTTFRGMGKEELLMHSSKPFWVRLRMICVGLILLGWLALIITVVALVFAYPKCRDKDARTWWQNGVMYRIHVRSFYDSDGDGNGDLKGVQAKLDYLSDVGVGTVSLSPIYQMDGNKQEFRIIDHKMIDPMYGTIQDFKNLVKAVHDKGMKIVLDFIPNHTSDQHRWFTTTNKDYYVWTDTVTNWNSVTGGSAWEMNATRGEYYLHQFDVGLPDLNLRSSMLLGELKNIMEYWMITENIDGFNIRNSGYMMEDYDMRNETRSNLSNKNTTDYDYYNHDYTYGVDDNNFLLSRFREIANDLSNTSTKILMADRRGTSTEKISYYGSFSGSGVHLSVNPIGSGICNGQCIKQYTMEWLNKFSTDKWPSWVTGNEEMSRFATRFPANYSRPFYMLTMLLPGTPILYYGDEIGMTDLTGVSQNAMKGLMQWENKTNAGFQNCSTCSNPPWIGVNDDYGTVNTKQQTNTDGSLYKFIKELATLRTNDAFRYGEFTTAGSTNNIFSFVREFDGVTGYLVAINFGDKTEKHDYTSFHGTIQATASAVIMTGSDVDFSAEDDVDTTSLSLGPLQGIVVSWDYKAKEL